MVAETIGGGIPKLGRDGRQLRAAGAIRVSSGKQSEGHSPETQRLAILARAHADGYAMDPEDVYEDHQRGHVLTRRGYVTILKGVREGRYGAIYVFMLDRWERDSIERQVRGKELDKLGVPVISVIEGKDEPGLVRVIRAELAEEESRKNAQRVTPNCEKAAREGTLMGPTPFGYTRIYPEWAGKGHRPPGLLTPHEPEASEVRQLFSRYASGLWSTRELAEDLNARGITGTKGHSWSTQTVCAVLRNPVYVGDVRYNQQATGHYVQAAPGSMFVVEGKHKALVDRAVFDVVQRRPSKASAHRSVARRRHPHLLAGLVQCHLCGGLMVANMANGDGRRSSQLRCGGHYAGHGCRGSSYRLDLTEQALLAQVKRLQGSPWSMERELALAGDQGARAAELAQQLLQAREKLTRANRRLMIEIDEPTPEDRAAFELVRSEQGQRIADLEHQLAELQTNAQDLPRLKQLHAQLTVMEIPTLVDRLVARGDHVGLRDLLVSLVESAVLVERIPATRSTWLRCAVTWSADVTRLLDAGLLHLAPDVEKPA